MKKKKKSSLHIGTESSEIRDLLLLTCQLPEWVGQSAALPDEGSVAANRGSDVPN